MKRKERKKERNYFVFLFFSLHETFWFLLTAGDLRMVIHSKITTAHLFSCLVLLTTFLLRYEEEEEEERRKVDTLLIALWK